MVSFASIPIVGKTPAGNLASLVVAKENNRSIIGTNVASIGTTSTTADPTDPSSPVNTTKTWDSISINSMYSNGTTLVAMATGSKSDNSNFDLCWTNASGTMKVGANPFGNLRNNGIAKVGDDYLVTGPSGQMSLTNFKFTNNNPMNGFTNTAPSTVKQIGNGFVADGISTNGTISVVTSTTTIGTWVNNSTVTNLGNWTRAVGEVELVKTTHKSTSYTFPGYAGSNPQIQRINAIPRGDSQPVIWNTDPNFEASEGYYGIIGGPKFDLTWTK